MRAFPRPAGSLPPTSTSTTCGATTKGSKTGPRTRSIGLHYRRYEQLHDERSITYEPHEAVQANPAASEDESRVRQSDEPPLQNGIAPNVIRMSRRAASAQLIPEDTSQRGPSARCGCSVRSGWKVRYVIANGSANSARATVLSTAFCQKPDHS